MTNWALRKDSRRWAFLFRQSCCVNGQQEQAVYLSPKSSCQNCSGELRTRFNLSYGCTFHAKNLSSTGEAQRLAQRWLRHFPLLHMTLKRLANALRLIDIQPAPFI